MFFGEKLQSIRELKGLSRKELAELIGVSEQAIWQYENGYTIPKFEMVNELKKIFFVKAHFFYTEPFITKVSDIEKIAYRADDRSSRRKTKMETTFIDYIHFFLQTFEEKLLLPQNTITSLRDETMRAYYQDNDTADKTLLLEDIANDARTRLNIDQNQELLYKLERAGVYILEKNMGPDIDAYSTWVDTNKAFIILGNEKKSAVRRNFDLAHELGHLLLHYYIDMDTLTKDEHREVEKEANAFASYFLLPKEAFLKDFATVSKKSNPKSYVDLKIKHMVSIQTLEYRAYKLGLLTFEENRYFYAVLNKYGFRKIEPLDEDIAIVRPGKIRALLDVVFKNKLLTLPDTLQEYQIDRSFLESLFGIDKDFLQKYDANFRNDYYDHEKIIPLF